MANNKVIIGNEEWCAFPMLGVPAVKARVDSGARTSVLHAINIERFERDNEIWVKFDVDPLINNRQLLIHCEARVVDWRTIKNSFGHSENRYVIKTRVALGDFLWDTEVSLTNRKAMEYRMLLGRNTLQDHVLIDPAKGCYFGDKNLAELSRLYGLPGRKNRQGAHNTNG